MSSPCRRTVLKVDGSLKRGPAEKALTPYEVEVVDGQLLPA